MRSRAIKAVVLDWSGTLSDDRRLVWTANMAIFRHYGVEEIPFEEFTPKVKMTVIEMAHDFGIEASPEAIISLYKQQLGLCKSNGLLPQLYPNAREALSHLKSAGMKTAVLSSHPRTHLRVEAGDFGLAGLLSMLVGDSTDKAADLAKIAAALHARPHEVLYIGDTVYDIQAAKKAGVQSAAVCQGYHTQERLAAENPDFLLESLVDLVEVVEGAKI